MITVTVYHRDKGLEYERLLADLDVLQAVVPHQLVSINLNSDKALLERIGQNLPVIEIGPYRMNPPFTARIYKLF